MHSHDFYVVLPSNSIASKELFPNNKPSSFRTKLAQPVSLHGNWEVGVAEIHLPFSWRNVDNFNQRFQVGATNMDHLYANPKEQDAADSRKRQKEIDDQDETDQKRLKDEKDAETARIAAETAEAARIAAEAARIAAEAAETARLAAEAETRRLAAEAETRRLAAEAETRRLAAEAETRRLAAERDRAKLQISKTKKGETKVVQKPAVIEEPPTPETIVKLEPKEYRNAMHFFRDLKRKMKKQNLANDFVINYHPGKDGRPSAITVSMGDKHGVTFNVNKFWTDTLGISENHVGSELNQNHSKLILHPKITNDITLTGPLVLDLKSTESGISPQTIRIDPPVHFKNIQELTNLINNQIQEPYTGKIEFILDKSKKEIRLKVDSGNYILLSPESAELWEQLGISNDQIGVPLTEEDQAIQLMLQPPQPLKVDKEVSLKFVRRKGAKSPQKRPDPVEQQPPVPDEVKHMQKPKLVTKKVYYKFSHTFGPNTYEGGAQELFDIIRDTFAKNWLLDRSKGIYLDYDEPLGKPPTLTITGGEQNQIAFGETELGTHDVSKWHTLIGIPKHYTRTPITLEGEDKPVHLTLWEPQLEEFTLKIDAKMYFYDTDGQFTEIKLPAGSTFKGRRVTEVFYAIKNLIPEKFRDKIQFRYIVDTNTLYIKVEKGYSLDFYGGGQSRKQWVDTIGIPRRYVGVNIDHNAMKGATWLKIDLNQMKPPTPLVLTKTLVVEVKKYKGLESTWIDEAEEQQQPEQQALEQPEQQPEQQTLEQQQQVAVEEQQDQPQQQEEEEGQEADYDYSLPPFKIFDIYIEQGHYTTIQDLLETANKKIQLRIREGEYQLKLKLEANGHVRADIGEAFSQINNINRQYFLRFPTNPAARGFDLGTMLGFSENQLDKWMRSPGELANYFPDIGRGVHSIFLFTDLVLPQYVGDSIAPLVRIINPTVDSGSLYKRANGSRTDMTSYHFKNIYYYPLARNSFDTIEIELRTNYGRLLQFVSGKTLVQLHFRRAL
jgi:hypothetical protein